MAQPHNKKLGEYPMTTRGREQGPEKRYRRLRFPAFTAAKWTTANPLLQRGELGVETDTRKIKVGDGITYWNDLEYAKASGDWGDITGDITEQTDLVEFVNNAVAAEASIRAQADQQLQSNIDNVAADLTEHEQDTSNPHNVTKAQVGLGNVDNTSDIDKPVSTAQATAINNAVSTHNVSETAHSNQFSQYRTSASQDTIDNQIKSDIANLQSTKADKATTLAGYGITDAYTKTEVDAKVSSVYRFRGSVATYANLPTTGQVVGDVWNVEDTGANYAWSGSEWDKLSETVDLTPYLTKEDAARTYATITTVNGKQDTLTTEQLAAVNSGITAEHVASYDAYAGEISAAKTTADKADNAAEVAQQTANLAGQEAAQALSGLAGKVNVAQGTANAGKVLSVGDDGNITLVNGGDVASVLPIGATVQYCGDNVPDNFMWCDGSAISRTTYASLFAVIGTKYGKGNGSTTFNLPNFNSAVPWGAPDWDAWQGLKSNTDVTLPYDGYLLVTNGAQSNGITIWYGGRQLMKFTPTTTTSAENSRTMLIPFRKGQTIRVESNNLDSLNYYKLKPTVPTEKWIIRYI